MCENRFLDKLLRVRFFIWSFSFSYIQFHFGFYKLERINGMFSSCFYIVLKPCLCTNWHLKWILYIFCEIKCSDAIWVIMCINIDLWIGSWQRAMLMIYVIWAMSNEHVFFLISQKIQTLIFRTVQNSPVFGTFLLLRCCCDTVEMSGSWVNTTEINFE